MGLDLALKVERATLPYRPIFAPIGPQHRAV